MNVYQTIPPYNLSWMKSRTFFNQILKEEAINLIDIGARNTSCEELEPLKDCLNYIGFESDEIEARRLNEKRNADFKSFLVIPKFVGTKAEKIDFNIFKNKGESSKLKPNPYFQEYFGDFFEISDTVSIDSVNLDDVLKSNMITPDIIKLDTQGTEFEILNSSPRSLESSLLIESEIEFVQMYKSQKLFYDVCSLLYESGFELLYLNRVFSSSKRFKGESRGQIIFGDALFGKRRDLVKQLSLERKLKYCVMLINYGHIDFAYDIFNENEDLKIYSDSLMKFFKTSFRTEKRSFLQKIKFGLKCQIEKLLYLTLVARKTNGLRSDSDRSWPVR